MMQYWFMWRFWQAADRCFTNAAPEFTRFELAIMKVHFVMGRYIDMVDYQPKDAE